MDTSQSQNPLRTIAYEIIDAKHGEGISNIMRETIAEELVSTMERYVNNELLNRLNNDQAEAYVTFMQADHSEDEVVTFLAQYSVDTKAVVSAALLDFRDNYLES